MSQSAFQLGRFDPQCSRHPELVHFIIQRQNLHESHQRQRQTTASGYQQTPTVNGGTRSAPLSAAGHDLLRVWRPSPLPNPRRPRRPPSRKQPNRRHRLRQTLPDSCKRRSIVLMGGLIVIA